MKHQRLVYFILMGSIWGTLISYQPKIKGIPSSACTYYSYECVKNRCEYSIKNTKKVINIRSFVNFRGNKKAAIKIAAFRFFNTIN